MTERRIVPVSTLVHYLKGQFEANPVLHGVLIEGEISNLRIPYSGHWYFSLKDDKASLACVMFASANKSVRFTPKNGDKVILRGDVTVYEAEGRMQMIANGMRPSGIGDLYLKFEALKKKLSQEGLFNPSFKKSLPLFPMDIAIVTGNQTAARSDVLITLKKRWPVAKVTEYTAPMQGAAASAKIIDVLKNADSQNHDFILLVRGGGSLEDLWCFNDEALARFIFQMNTPIVTGVGHETDTTLVDYVSDVRANTPTGAVEISTPDIHEVSDVLTTYKIRLENTMKHRIQMEHVALEQLKNSSGIKNILSFNNEKIMHLDYLEEKLYSSMHRIDTERTAFHLLVNSLNQQIYRTSATMQKTINDYKTKLVTYSTQSIQKERIHMNGIKQTLIEVTNKKEMTEKNRLGQNIKLLDAYSPLKILDRGYSITLHEGNAVDSIKQVNSGDIVTIRVADGALKAEIKEKESNHGTGEE